MQICTSDVNFLQICRKCRFNGNRANLHDLSQGNRLQICGRLAGSFDRQKNQKMIEMDLASQANSALLEASQHTHRRLT
jgi:hypothetical protein